MDRVGQEDENQQGERIYEMLYPAPGEYADHHRLEYFQPFCGEFIDDLVSKPWKMALAGELAKPTHAADEVY